MRSIIAKLSLGLSKTRESLFGTLHRLILSKRSIDDDVLNQLEEALIAADVGVETTSAIVDRIKVRVKNEGYESSGELLHLLRDEVAGILSASSNDKGAGVSRPAQGRLSVVMIVGVNGVGKTTTVGKLAALLKNEGLKVVVGAADTFRAAANEQLEIWARRAGVDIIRHAEGTDPASVAFESLNAALARNADVLLIDTAGRLHTKVNLMDELRKIRRVLEKKMPGSPHEVLLVIDASTGQNGLQQVRQFREATGVTGIVLTKLDGTAKGGIVLAMSHELKIPVKYVGVGEQLDDLQPFDKGAFVDALFEKEPNAVDS